VRIEEIHFHISTPITIGIKFLNYFLMNASDILVKPILTEKANGQQEKLRRYAFRVSKKANKLEIKKAIEAFYGVTVTSVNTAIVPAKAKSRSTKAGVISGRKPGYKKAFVTVAEGETIDLYANI
jgi:large subunit ribosomal protein L23